MIISSGDYKAAFDAAAEAARSEGMSPLLRDRRSGIIETEAEISPSLLEPWRPGNASFAQAVDNTLSFQRRRVRFEFNAAQPRESSPPAEIETPIASGQPVQPKAPDILGMETPLEDLTQREGDLELRVWVFIERATSPGLRRSTWTRHNTTRTELVVPEGLAGQDVSTHWQPMTRDLAAERRLLAAVQDALGQPGGH